jgi:hypothetical protein
METSNSDKIIKDTPKGVLDNYTLAQVKMHSWVDAYAMVPLHDVVVHMIWCNATWDDLMHKFL